ncbi:MAG: DUF2512 family protein [Bacteroidota bacterium]
MSRTVWALVLKFALTFVAAWIAFKGLGRNTFGSIALVAVLGTALNYIVGDLGVLPRYGNVTAAAGDGVLAALTAYVVDAAAYRFNTTFGSLVLFGVIVAVAEYFFHQFLLRTKDVAP